MDQPINNRKRKFVYWGLAAAIIFILANWLFSSDDLGLELRADRGAAINGVLITNVRPEPITLLDVAINGGENACAPNALFSGPYKNVVLRTGQRAVLSASCEIVTVTVKTNKGTGTYSFR